jgi:hypothetical protein
MSDEEPKLIAIDEEANHQIVHGDCFGKAPIRRLLSRGNTSWVAYPVSADNVPGPLSTRLRRAYQPVISTRNLFSTPRTSLLTYI